MAKLQNLSSASLALRNMGVAHERALALANAEVARQPEKHITGLSLKVLEPPSPAKAFYSPNPCLSGREHVMPTSPSLSDAIAALTPYTTFHGAAIVLSAIVTTETVELDAHWTSDSPPRPLSTPTSSSISSSASSSISSSSSSPTYRNQEPSSSPSSTPSSPRYPSSSQSPLRSASKTYYLRHRLAKWSIRNEISEARRGLEVAIELVSRETEGRMGAALDVLEGAHNRGMVGRGMGYLKEDGEVLVAQDRGFL